jgi:hypothetical protein
MKRMRVLFGKRRTQLLVTAAVLLLAAGVVVGSGANFSTTAASAGNTFTAGYVALTPSGTLSFGPLAPSAGPDPAVSGEIGVQNTGNVRGIFYLDIEIAAADGTNPNGGFLHDVLRVRVYDFAGAQVYDGLLSGMTEFRCGTLDPGGADAVTVEPYFLDSDGDPDDPLERGSENQYQESVAAATANWTVVSY